MKSLTFLTLFMIFSNSAFAAPVNLNGAYTCTFNNGKVNTWFINGQSRKITVQSSAHNGLINIDILESTSFGAGAVIQFGGLLPSPWAAGTTFQIQLRDTMFTSTLRIAGPNIEDGSGRVVQKGQVVSIPMVCR